MKKILTERLLLIMVMVAVLAVIVMGRNLVLEHWSEQAELREKQLKQEAVVACSSVATVTWKERKAGSEIVEPYQPAFEQCMLDAGY